MLNGILVIDKDRGMTSADVVYRLRKILKIRKIGHAGTLDPDVTGVLPIVIGQATKLINLMHTFPKKYVGRGRFGLATDSYDLSGQITKKQAITSPFSAAEIQAKMGEFEGKIEQRPPIYSAVRVRGKHLYEYARAGIKVERPKRHVKIFSFRLLSSPNYNAEKKEEDFSFALKCGKGTYVRSLVNDLGEKLGVPAVMTSLKRTASSGFNLKQAVVLKKVADHPEKIKKWLRPIDDFFIDKPSFNLSSTQWFKVKNGATLTLPTERAEVALRYHQKIKAIYYRTEKGYQPRLMLLKNEEGE